MTSTGGTPTIADTPAQGRQAVLCRDLARQGFSFVPATAMRGLLESHGGLADWPAFAASWDDLHLDRHMADGGRYRRRRHAVYTVAADGAFRREPHQAHFQELAYNPLNGGVPRWFEPVTAEVGTSRALRTILHLCAQVFGALAPAVQGWRAELHQFRIEAVAGQAGLPTPEGPHRDGVDYVLVLLVARHNIEQGTTTVYGPDRAALGSFTLTEPLDAAFVDDARVFHGVTPVRPLAPSQPAYRDVLVVTFKAAA